MAHLYVRFAEVDMQDLPYEDNIFDFVISGQVIEHLADPKKAIEESYRAFGEGRIAKHTTCFINHMHPCPKDYWRFSPQALEHLCKQFQKKQE